MGKFKVSVFRLMVDYTSELTGCPEELNCTDFGSEVRHEWREYRRTESQKCRDIYCRRATCLSFRIFNRT